MLYSLYIIYTLKWFAQKVYLFLQIKQLPNFNIHVEQYYALSLFITHLFEWQIMVINELGFLGSIHI